MRDVGGVGRVLVASLHQGIADVIPARLVFYENWLTAEGLRDGTIGVAPLSAVLSFLRQEGAAYDLIMKRAGEYATDWTVESMLPMRRAMLGAMPAWLRARLLLGLARKLVRSSYQRSRAVSSVRRGVASVDLHDSVFCTVREPVAHPLCGFYAAAVTELFQRFGLSAVATVSSCRATSAATASCVLKMPLRAPVEEARPAA
jgi:hypothetical protein